MHVHVSMHANLCKGCSRRSMCRSSRTCSLASGWGGGGAAAHLIGWDSTTTGSVPVPFPVWSHSRKPYRPSSGVPSQLLSWKSMKLSTGETEAATSQIPNVRWMAWLSCLSETVFGPQQLVPGRSFQDVMSSGVSGQCCLGTMFGARSVSYCYQPSRPKSWSLCPP